jgi:hypothetical protein
MVCTANLKQSPQTIKKQLKKFLVIFGIVFIGWWIVPLGLNYAQDTESAHTTAILDVEPQIAVQVQDPAVNVTNPAIGEFDVTVRFSVQANIKQVNMFVEATDFYFDDHQSAQEVDPIDLVTSTGVEIDPTGATPLGDGNTASYIGDGDPIEGYPSRKTDTISFHSNDDHAFNHSVAVTVRWNQDDPVKPAGQYHAKVKLACAVEPAEH